MHRSRGVETSAGDDIVSASSYLRAAMRAVVRRIPGGSRLAHEVRAQLHARRSRQEIFEQIYVSNAWGSSESLSGVGSELESTRAIREELPRLWLQYGTHSLVDAPCGDFHWMKEIVHCLDEYT